jgi:hypothetical protein
MSLEEIGKMHYLSAIGNAVVTARDFSGNLVTTIFDGPYGIGPVHSKLLSIGGDRVLGVGVQMGIAGYLGHINRGEPWDYETTKWVIGFALAAHVLISTRLFYKPITGEMVKQAISNSLLTAIDLYTMRKLIDEPNERSLHSLYNDDDDNDTSTGPLLKTVAAIYLTLRSLDLVVNFGAVSEGLIRLNPEPLLGNLQAISTWVQ